MVDAAGQSSSYDQDRIQQAGHHLGQAGDHGLRASSILGDVQGAQGSSKWGVQPGPSHFRTSYSSKLDMLAAQVSALHTKLDSLASSTSQIGKDAADADQAMAQQFGQTETTVNHQTRTY